MKRPGLGITVTAALATFAISTLLPLGAQAALGSRTAEGDPAAGKIVFSANCAACHTLKAAAAAGTVGPNLDNVKLTEAIIATAVSNGGRP